MVMSSLAPSSSLWAFSSQLKYKQTRSPETGRGLSRQDIFWILCSKCACASFPSVAFMGSFWRQGKPEQSNLVCLHLLYQDQQAQTAGAAPTCAAKMLPCPWGGCWLFSLQGYSGLALLLAKQQMSSLKLSSEKWSPRGQAGSLS